MMVNFAPDSSASNAAHSKEAVEIQREKGIFSLLTFLSATLGFALSVISLLLTWYN